MIVNTVSQAHAVSCVKVTNYNKKQDTSRLEYSLPNQIQYQTLQIFISLNGL